MMQLRDSQRVALERLTEPGRHFAALWAEPRSGKTAVALRWIEHVAPRVAIVVGPKVAEATWRTEAAKWVRKDYRFFPLTAGNDYPQQHQLKAINIMFVNYEQFTKGPFKRLRPFLKKMSDLSGGQGAMLLDESHTIKKPNTVMGKNIRPLAAFWHYRLLMTGTPVTNPSQVDAVYGQWTFLDPGIRDHWASARDFREHFGEWTTKKGFPELVRPRNQYELNAYIQPHVITMTREDSKPVPIRKVRYPVPRQVMQWHKVLFKKGVVEGMLGHDVAALNPLTRLLRMRTLVAGWVTDDEGQQFAVPEAARARLGALGHIVRRCDGKIIIACTHLREIRLVERWLTRKGIGHLIITGKTKNKNHVIEDFQRDRDARVLLVQPRTVAMAVDISVANDLIWYTSDFSYVTFKQASDRIKLSPASPTVWFLAGKGSVDEDVWATLQEDHDHLKKVVKRISSGGLGVSPG
ncbi:DNA helicase [Microbacterium phage Lucky3]|uniref:DNA helicase n=2 Tax=Kojivirus golden TaxID=2560590 RepID=A0A2P1CFS4_9CAUD|nr:DNA helicase [Microbacterium phage Golden]AVJ49786.1 DNA helicase [Microbacterium phage Golden]AVJ50096.1 DNA helicase [Microbacterium phage Lucky3]